MQNGSLSVLLLTSLLSSPSVKPIMLCVSYLLCSFVNDQFWGEKGPVITTFTLCELGHLSFPSWKWCHDGRNHTYIQKVVTRLSMPLWYSRILYLVGVPWVLRQAADDMIDTCILDCVLISLTESCNIWRLQTSNTQLLAWLKTIAWNKYAPVCAHVC